MATDGDMANVDGMYCHKGTYCCSFFTRENSIPNERGRCTALTLEGGGYFVWPIPPLDVDIHVPNPEFCPLRKGPITVTAEMVRARAALFR